VSADRSDAAAAPDTKTRILEVAQELFAAQGFDATGIDQIAREVGITKSVIYYHYRNKEAILDALISHAFEQMMSFKEVAGERFFRGGLSLEDYAEHTDAFKQAAQRFKPIIRIMLMETLKGGERAPLFDVWQGNCEFVRDTWGQYMRPEVFDDPHSFLQETFFFLFLPWVGWYVFEDAWCARYDIDPDRFRRDMVHSFSALFESFIRPRVWGDGIDRAREEREAASGASEGANGDAES
jgi:AcrR family transcriptional regulator